MIGSGTHGCVYIEENNAIKYQTPISEDECGFMGLVEYDVMSRCGGHPNVVATLGFKRDAIRGTGIIMPLYRYNLEDYLKSNSPLSVDGIRNVLSKILLGLEYLHLNRVIHGDFKSNNVLCNEDCSELAVCDFSGSTVVYNLRYPAHGLTTNEQHRSPEMYREEEYTSKIDLWAVGILLEQMVFPKKKRRYSDYVSRMFRKTEGSFEGLTEPDVAKYPLEIRRLIVGLLRINPHLRMTATEALADTFFDPIREGITDVQMKYNSDKNSLPTLPLIRNRDKVLVCQKTMSFIKRISKKIQELVYPVVFHGVDIFERYLEKSHISPIPERTFDLYLTASFYLAYKLVNPVPISIGQFFEDDIDVTEVEEIELKIISTLDGRIFSYTYHEIVDDFSVNYKGKFCDHLLKRYLHHHLNMKNETIEQDRVTYRSLYRDYIQKMKLEYL